MVWTISCILFCIVFLVVLNIYVFDVDNDNCHPFLSSLGTIFISFLIWILGLLLGTIILNEIISSPLKRVTYLKEKVYSLDISNGNQISGAFFLGCGGFSSSQGVKYLMFGDNPMEIDISKIK